MNTSDSFYSGEGSLLRARLHLRAGKRRLQQGKISAGLLTLYDAFLFAMNWYISSADRKACLDSREGEDLNDDKVLFAVLARSGVVDPIFSYRDFDELIDRAAHEELVGYDYTGLLGDIVRIMHQLRVLPFDESVLPPEDPETF